MGKTQSRNQIVYNTSTLEDSDSDETKDIDFDKTMKEEAEATSLDRRRE